MVPVDRCVRAVSDIVNFSNSVRSDFTDSVKVGRAKKEMLWVNVPIIDKSSSLLWAATWVACVDQTTLIVHELVKIASGTREALSKVVGRDLHDLTAHGVADAEDFSEGKDQSLSPIKTEQHPGRTRYFGLFDQHRHIHWNASWIREIQVRSLIDRGSIG